MFIQLEIYKIFCSKSLYLFHEPILQQVIPYEKIAKKYLLQDKSSLYWFQSQHINENLVFKVEEPK